MPAKLPGANLQNLEIIVIDDGSSDNSRAIVQGFDHAYPQIRTFRQNRGGVTEARNYGMRKATGQYLFFMDADDDLPAQSLEVLVERAVETQADITAGTTLHLTEKRELIARMNYIPFSTLSGEEWLTTIRKTWQGHLWGLLFRKSLFEHPLLCPLSLKIGEDLLQVTQLAMRSHLVAMTPQTVYHYIKRETSAINSRQFPPDIRQGDEILFVETMLHLQKRLPQDECGRNAAFYPCLQYLIFRRQVTAANFSITSAHSIYLICLRIATSSKRSGTFLPASILE